MGRGFESRPPHQPIVSFFGFTPTARKLRRQPRRIETRSAPSAVYGWSLRCEITQAYEIGSTHSQWCSLTAQIPLAPPGNVQFAPTLHSCLFFPQLRSGASCPHARRLFPPARTASAPHNSSAHSNAKVLCLCITSILRTGIQFLDAVGLKPTPDGFFVQERS